VVAVHLLGFQNQCFIALVLAPATFVAAHAEFMNIEVVFDNTREPVLKHFKGFIAILMQTVRTFLFQSCAVDLIE